MVSFDFEQTAKQMFPALIISPSNPSNCKMIRLNTNMCCICVFPHVFKAFVCLCGLMLVMSEWAAPLPMVERVGLVTGSFGVLGGEGEADLPEKKDRPCGYQLG